MPTDTAHGQAADNAQGSDDAPKTVTEEQLNKAITARLNAFEKKMKDSFSATLQEFGTNFDSLLGSKLEELVGRQSAGAEKQKGNVEDDPKYNTLLKKMKDLEKSNEEIQQRAAAETAKARDIKLRQTLAEELARNGVDNSRARHAIGYLVDSEKRVRYEDDGEGLVFTDEDGTDVDLGAGIRAWAKSDEAKMYLPPRGTVGSGDRPPANGKTNTNGKGPPDKAQAANMLAEVLGIR